MESNVTGYEITILNAVFLAIAYIIIGMIIPTFFNTTLWKPFGGKFSAWINIVTLIMVSTAFFISTARNMKYKADVFKNITITGVLLSIGCSVLFYLLLDNFLDQIFDSMFPASAEEYQESIAALRQSPVTTFIRICLFAPITEELLMRGYLLTGLQNKYGAVTALLVTTALFSALHFNFVQTLSAVICGLIIGLLYIKTDSLFCCILAHALYNSISYFTVIVVKS